MRSSYECDWFVLSQWQWLRKQPEVFKDVWESRGSRGFTSGQSLLCPVPGAWFLSKALAWILTLNQKANLELNSCAKCGDLKHGYWTHWSSSLSCWIYIASARICSGALQYFAGVSAIEISPDGHDWVNSNTEVTFEDVVSLCRVMPTLRCHSECEVADTDHPGHPCADLQAENLARAAPYAGSPGSYLPMKALKMRTLLPWNP